MNNTYENSTSARAEQQLKASKVIRMFMKIDKNRVKIRFQALQ